MTANAQIPMPPELCALDPPLFPSPACTLTYGVAMTRSPFSTLSPFSPDPHPLGAVRAGPSPAAPVASRAPPQPAHPGGLTPGGRRRG